MLRYTQDPKSSRQGLFIPMRAQKDEENLIWQWWQDIISSATLSYGLFIVPRGYCQQLID